MNRYTAGWSLARCVAIGLAAAVLVAFVYRTHASSLVAPACAGRGTAIVIVANGGNLYLCNDGRSDGEYSVSMGRGGVGKTREGDAKTPIGTYPLGSPRASAEFHLFIPVGYPTETERSRGYSGGDIGIHGPKRGWRWLGRAVNLVNWTAGCIAVNRDEDIDAIAAWTRAEHPQKVVILRSPDDRSR